MDFKTFFIKKILIGFFVSVTCISVVMAVVGILFVSDARFGYEAFFSPILFGVIAIVPSLVTYSKEELSLKQTIIRKIIHFILIEVLILLVLYLVGGLTGVGVTISLAVSILVIDLTVHLVLWINDRRIANELNLGLKDMQSRHIK